MIINCIRCKKKFDKIEIKNLLADEYNKYKDLKDEICSGCFMLFIYKK